MSIEEAPIWVVEMTPPLVSVRECADDRRTQGATTMEAPLPPVSAAPLAPAQVAALLAATAGTIEGTFKALPPPVLTWRPAPGEWCALEVLGHLVETEERGFAGRIRAIRTENRPQFTGWDPDAVARERRDAERDPAEVLGEFTRRRAESVALLETVSAKDVSQGGDHPDVGFLTINDLLHEWIHHDANHLRQLLANVQAYAWPGMGNARRFSMPE